MAHVPLARYSALPISVPRIGHPRPAPISPSSQIIVKGSTWGEDIILNWVAPALCRPMHAKAMNHAEVYLVSWDALEDALVDFPNSANHVRRCAVRLAARRQIVRIAKLVKHRGYHSIFDLNEADLAESSCPDGRQVTMKRSKTLKKMMAASVEVSDAEVMLQKRLMARRNSCHDAGFGSSPALPAPIPQLPSDRSVLSAHNAWAPGNRASSAGHDPDAAESDGEDGADSSSVKVQFAPAPAPALIRAASSRTANAHSHLAAEVERQSALLKTMGTSIQSICHEMNHLRADIEPIKSLSADMRTLMAALGDPKSPMSKALAA